MKWNWAAAASAALAVAIAAPVAQADSISGVEGARAKDRAGYHLNRQDREQLRRYGRNDDYGWRGGYRNYGYYGGPGVSVYIGPGGYGDPYGY
ncbi:hypothetical protein DLM45_03140 [Hyphomicrobium methylovorum]|uniref:hypothetical protein n=1 Tax=Hyphomicrobium methylovorum TaxID=84 RepID=UPI0015E7CD3B|nr:hypothetical protein [Hyphomicrobium methylovorum]MBA2125219.1 hypothetical protein [Hyphomicrobium methylovorum]